jgi:uncharacterized membrane protein YdjX (TVP38/TMEM64 family)
MPSVKSLWKNRQLRTTLLGLVVALVVLGFLGWLTWPFISAFEDLDSVKEFVRDAGPWGPVVFVFMQILQVVFAPVPGQVVGFVGGFLFGTLWGTALSMIGTTLGFAIVFTLSRKLGRPFVEYFVSQKNLKKFDYLAATKGIWILIVAFLLPIIPDAMTGYIAGLSTIRIRVLLLISFIGRLPGIFILSYVGGEAANANYTFAAVVVGLFTIGIGLAYLQRDRLQRLAKRFTKKN